MKERFRYAKSLLSTTYQEWSQRDAQTQGAALSYYTVLSLAPLLVIAVSIAGLAFSKQVVQGQIIEQMRGLVGPGADAVRTMLTHTQSPGAGIVASIASFVVLIFGASGVFTQLRKALNLIWDVKAKQQEGWFGMLRQQFFSFAMVVGIGFLLLVSLLLTTVLAGVAKFAGNYLPSSLLQIGNGLFSLAVITLVFALIYRFVPEQTLPWRRLWPGSIATAILFVAGKYLLGLYLGRASVTSSYGAAGSLVVLFIWVYYSSQLFLFGAEFTRIYSCHAAGVCLNAAQPAAEKEERGSVERTADQGIAAREMNDSKDRGPIPITGAAPDVSRGAPSAMQLARDSLARVEEIVRSEIRLARTELREAAGRAGKSSAILEGGALLALFGLCFVLLVGVFALSIVVPLWLAFLIEGVLLGGVAATLVARGRRGLQRIKPAAETVASVKDTLAWAKERTG